jgi:ABC-type sugar transport system substrate-binding protein
MNKGAFLIVFLLSLSVSAVCGKAPVPTDEAPVTASQAEAPGAQGVEPGGEYPRPPKPSRPYTIGVVLPHLSNPHFVGQAYGYLDEAHQLGARVTLLEAGGYQHLDRQISQIEDLVADKVDAIILVAVSGPGTMGAVDLAVSAGIPVINCNVMTDSDKVVTRVRSDDEEIGLMQADVMGQALEGRGHVVMLRGAPGTSWAENRGNAFKKRLSAKFPDVMVVGEQYSQSTPADGLRLMEDFMQTYAQIDGVYNGADSTAVGAAQAILASGNKGRLIVTTTDFQSDTEAFMREGLITAAVVQQTVVIGRWGVRAAINYLEKRPVTKTLWTPLLLITADTVDKLDMRGVRAPEGWKPPTR